MKQISLYGKHGEGLVTLVDDSNFDFLNQWKWNGYKDKGGRIYVGRKEREAIILIHRVIMETPQGFLCDHADRDTLNNQEYNLRNCTFRQNNANRKSSINGTSKYLGVHKSLKRRKHPYGVYEYERWTAQIIAPSGKKKCIGDFKTEDEAGHAYDVWALKYHGEFANLNFK